MKVFFFSLLVSFSASAQDSIILKSGTRKNVILLESTAESVHYKPNDKSPNSFWFAKMDVAELYRKDGTREKIETQKLSLVQLQEKIVSSIQQGLADKSERKLSARFDGEILVVSELDRNGESKDAVQLDLAKVHLFHPVSNRSEELAYVNLYVEAREGDNDAWHKIRWVEEFKNPEYATLLTAYLRSYNALLVEKYGPFKPYLKR